MAALIDWKARDVNGRLLERKEFLHTSNLPRHGISEMVVATDAGALRVKLSPDRGEVVRVFTLRKMAVTGLNASGETEDTVIVEITPDPEKPMQRLRLCIGREVVLTTGEE